jgi:hypothetical protein
MRDYLENMFSRHWTMHGNICYTRYIFRYGLLSNPQNLISLNDTTSKSSFEFLFLNFKAVNLHPRDNFLYKVHCVEYDLHFFRLCRQVESFLVKQKSSSSQSIQHKSEIKPIFTNPGNKRIIGKFESFGTHF